MESSRIFIKGLPPSISEDEFKKHFSAKQPITDAKLIAHRRIGYVGYKSPEAAAQAVKYFNRSFIRMSRIGVELARPIADAALPVSRKAQREEAKKRVAKRTEEEKAASTPQPENGLKRKRDDLDESDPKVKEFLQLMQPASKTKSWQIEGLPDDGMEEPPTKVQAMEMPEAESDEEYEAVPRKSKSTQALQPEARPNPPVDVPMTEASPTVGQPVVPENESIPQNSNVGDDDDEWLRSRTNRLLDLMDPDEIVPGNAEPVNTQPSVTPPVEEADARLQEPSETNPQTAEAAEAPVEVAKEEYEITSDAIRATRRLFIRNLPYTVTEDDLREAFGKHGALEEIHLPVAATGKTKGFAYVQYEDPAAAVNAWDELDGGTFQGRLLHIIPAAAKRETKLDDFALSKLPLKKQKQIKKKAEAASATFNWNSLYMNQDAVNTSVAERLGISKSELLDPTSADAGVKQAIAETSIIQETKSYFASNGVDLDAFKKKERGDTAILVKNFPFGMTIEEVRRMFEEYGQVIRVLMPPSGTIAVVEFAQPTHARAAFSSLAYRRIKDSVLFLEKAPKNLFTSVSNGRADAGDLQSARVVDAKPSATDLLEKRSEEATADTTTLFVRNLNFSTTHSDLADAFKPLDGFVSARVNTRTDPKKPGQILSMGFGFVEFKTKAQAQAALKAMDGYTLANHKLAVKASHKGLDAAEEQRRADHAKKATSKRTKIIIKNLPFEATKKDVRALFGSYGQLRSVRVPKKFDSSARGFAFADFITAREAENALAALKDTHLLGRRLVLEFAAEDAVDAEEEIARMQEKVGKQVDKMALQKLTGGGRKKFNIEGDENDDA